VSMAGSYKDLFEHLSSGYEKLSDKSARDVFRERVDTMLMGSTLEHTMIAGGTPEAAEAATELESEVTADPVSTPAGEDVMADQGAPAMPDGEPLVGTESAEAKAAAKSA